MDFQYNKISFNANYVAGMPLSEFLAQAATFFPKNTEADQVSQMTEVYNGCYELVNGKPYVAPVAKPQPQVSFPKVTVGEETK